MGYARVVAPVEGIESRYSIELDFGEAQREALLDAVVQAIAKLDEKIAEQQIDLDAAEDALDAAKSELESALAAFEAAGGDPIENAEELAAVILWTGRVQEQREIAVPPQLRMAEMKAERVALVKWQAYWSTLSLQSQRQAWCTTWTQPKISNDSIVGTIEVDADPDLILIAPGGRGWRASDGYVYGREIMSPAQAYWNAASLPGLQRHRPTYRWGTVTGINYGAGTLDVALAPATSSVVNQTLNINDRDTLADVPVTYLQCGVGAFRIDDKVIVQFEGQSWESPRVIGFLDNPRPCDVQLWWSSPTSWRNGYIIYSQDKIAQLLSGSNQADFRLDGGAWVTMELIEADVPSIVSPRVRFTRWREPDGFDYFVRLDLLVEGKLPSLEVYQPSSAEGSPATRADGMPAQIITEFRLRSPGGTLLVNMASTSHALAVGQSPDEVTRYVRAPGGSFGGWINPLVQPLEGYQLFIETESA